MIRYLWDVTRWRFVAAWWVIRWLFRGMPRVWQDESGWGHLGDAVELWGLAHSWVMLRHQETIPLEQFIRELKLEARNRQRD